MTNNESKYLVFYDKSEYDEYLAHMGVLGMKWGRRKDKKKSSNSRLRATIRAKAQKIKAKRAAQKVEKANKKANEQALKKTRKNISDSQKAKKLTNEELRKSNERMELEIKYNKLSNTLNPKKESISTKMGKSVIDGISEGSKKVISNTVSEIGKLATDELTKRLKKYIA